MRKNTPDESICRLYLYFLLYIPFIFANSLQIFFRLTTHSDENQVTEEPCA